MRRDGWQEVFLIFLSGIAVIGLIVSGWIILGIILVTAEAIQLVACVALYSRLLAYIVRLTPETVQALNSPQTKWTKRAKTLKPIGETGKKRRRRYETMYNEIPDEMMTPEMKQIQNLFEDVMQINQAKQINRRN